MAYCVLHFVRQEVTTVITVEQYCNACGKYRNLPKATKNRSYETPHRLQIFNMLVTSNHIGGTVRVYAMNSIYGQGLGFRFVACAAGAVFRRTHQKQIGNYRNQNIVGLMPKM